MNGIHHTGITVRDLDRSIDFYHEILGLEFTTEPTPVVSGDELARGVGVPGASLRAACLRAGNSIVELLQYITPESPLEKPPPNNAVGAAHVAFVVDDIEAKVRELHAKGVEFFSPVQYDDEGVLAGWRTVYFCDPDGIQLELVEIAYTRDEERHRGIEAYLAARKALSRQLPMPDPH
jgi:catechol 2,3-dioxygenase-like lactoylglutathione lyase family enzyme